MPPCARRCAAARGRAARHLRHRARSAPETGYGYIQRGAARSGAACPHRALRREARPRARATNSSPPASTTGTAACSCSAPRRYLEELAALCARHRDASASRPSPPRKRDLDFTRLDEAQFEACRSDSIDYAVMEKTARRGGRAARCRLERRRLLVVAARGAADADERRQRDCTATSSARTPTTATCTRAAAWSRPSGSTITSSSRPRTRCWSRRKERVQDVKELVTAHQGARPQRALRCTARCSGPGAATTASTTASASR